MSNKSRVEKYEYLLIYNWVGRTEVTVRANTVDEAKAKAKEAAGFDMWHVKNVREVKTIQEETAVNHEEYFAVGEENE